MADNNEENAEPETRIDHLYSSDDDYDYDYFLNSSNHSGWSVAKVVDGTPPASRSLHAAAILNNIFYCFGGYDGVARVNTFHAFSFAEKRWSPVLPSWGSAGPPSPRSVSIDSLWSTKTTTAVRGRFIRPNETIAHPFFRFCFLFSSRPFRFLFYCRCPSVRHLNVITIMFFGWALIICVFRYCRHYGLGLYLGAAAVRHCNARYHHCIVVVVVTAATLWDYQSRNYGTSFRGFRYWPVHLVRSETAGRYHHLRDRHVAVSFGNSFYVHGGFDGTSRVSDFWAFDLSSMTWREILASNRPSARHSHSAVVAPSSNRQERSTPRYSLYLFGGYDGSYSKFSRYCFIVEASSLFEYSGA